jgi:hypothetical protein
LETFSRIGKNRLIISFSNDCISIFCGPFLLAQEWHFRKGLNDLLFMPEQLYSTDMIESLSRGNSELIRKLISLFVTQTPEFVREMHQAYKEKDFATFKTLVHKIKPT